MSAHSPPGRILLMDDEALILQTTQELLELSGYEVVPFTDGEALVRYLGAEVAAGRAVGLVLMDLNIPQGMGGLDAARLIRASQPHLPIVLTSGYATDGVMSDPAAYGVDAGLRKPFRRSELLQVVERYLPRTAPPPTTVT